MGTLSPTVRGNPSSFHCDATREQNCNEDQTSRLDYSLVGFENVQATDMDSIAGRPGNGLDKMACKT